MRVLYHHRTASKDGQAVHIEEMIEAMRKMGHEVFVVSPASNDGERMGGQVGWVQKLRAFLPKAVYELLELAYTGIAYTRLSKAARLFKPDIIYERYNLFLLAGLLLKWRRRIPLFLEVNSPLAEERAEFGGLALKGLANWSERTAWRGADFVLPVTGVLAQYVYNAGVDRSRVVVVPNGINEEQFANVPGEIEARRFVELSDSLVIGFTGFVRDWHGVDRVIRWMARGNAPVNTCLLIVGDGPARASLETLAHEMGVQSRVKFTGFVERSRVPTLVAAFDIALQPAVTRYASPLKLFEYLALGKAIIAPRQPNIEEILSDGVNAVLFDPASPGELEGALATLCADPNLRAKVGIGARETIHRMNLTWRGNAECVTRLAQASFEARKFDGGSGSTPSVGPH